MLFTSGEFLIFFPIVVLLYFVLPTRVKQIWLLISSYFFYMCWNVKYALLLLGSTAVTYFGGVFIEIIKRRNTSENRTVRMKKFVLAIALLLNLGILFIYKYLNFAISILGRVFALFHVELVVPQYDIILPVGISFYIFQALGYLIDVYRDDIYAERNFAQYALFVSFFPQLVAGPIERTGNLLKQLAVPKRFDYENARAGLLTMIWGFFLKMVIADRCAILVDTVYKSYENYHGMELVIANVLFAIQIYCDFCGYSTIAQGAAKVLSIDLMDNFHQPYFATSIKDFWRRWHISLSTWFRDYLYIPLGGSRCGKVKKYRNLILTFLVSGLWHGASLTFVFWGLLHGLYQVIESELRNLCNKVFHDDTLASKLRPIHIIVTFAFVDVAWIFFRSNSVSHAVSIFLSSLRLDNVALVASNQIYELGLDAFNMRMLIAALIILLMAGFVKERGNNLIGWISKKNIIIRYGMYWVCLIMIIMSLDITGQEFLYFQF